MGNSLLHDLFFWPYTQLTITMVMAFFFRRALVRRPIIVRYKYWFKEPTEKQQKALRGVDWLKNAGYIVLLDVLLFRSFSHPGYYLAAVNALASIQGFLELYYNRRIFP